MAKKDQLFILNPKVLRVVTVGTLSSEAQARSVTLAVLRGRIYGDVIGDR